MNILYLSSVRVPSEKASGLAIVRQCEAFANAGNTLELLVPIRSSKNLISIEEAYGMMPNFTVKRIPSFSLYSFGRVGFYFMLSVDAIKMFTYYLKQGQFNLIYSRDQRLLLPFVMAGISSKCVLELHTKHTDFITRFVAKRVKKVFVISSGLGEFYESITARIDIHVEPSGVNVKQFASLSSQEELKNKFFLPVDKIVFGYVGKYQTMGEGKGVDMIIKAFSLAYKKSQNIHLMLVGIEDDEKDEVLRIINSSDLQIDSYSILKLDQSKFAEYLVASDVLLMNYPNTEHYAKYMSPTKLFAYMASERIIISSDLASVREIVDESMVIFTKPGDISDLQQKMFEVQANIESYKDMKQKTKMAVSKYSWAQRAERIISFLK